HPGPALADPRSPAVLHQQIPVQHRALAKGDVAVHGRQVAADFAARHFDTSVYGAEVAGDAAPFADVQPAVDRRQSVRLQVPTRIDAAVDGAESHAGHVLANPDRPVHRLGIGEASMVAYPDAAV